ncbi:helix-turn-helix transcriptional regulator [Rhizobium mesosinicum]|uniref:Helix-turn-helix transcriptional regulator n=1 Tax=Rhizobium mesosinicum TaxID=335017 RepID=A0ABS7GYA3_9HYPH|nr:helix-turn-helix transcriptional regulator [Rhizobium mesosinicum]MBW9054521.1 helix-turn-helix transcriptional regulator [Rhizobium mesosinicum]
MYPMQRDNADFIGVTMNYLGAFMGSDRIAFYRVDNGQTMTDFALQNIDHSFHNGYLSGMHAFDPLHVSRLNRADQRAAIYHLWRQERDCLPQAISKYRSFLSCFEISDVFELLFRFEGHVVAGASVLYRDRQTIEPLHISAAHAYIEFNLQRHIRKSGGYVRMLLTNKLGLSPREIEVIDLICCGRTNSEIAELLQIGMATVKTHLIRIYQKLGVENRASVVAFMAHLQ